MTVNGTLTNSGLFGLYGDSNRGLGGSDEGMLGALVNTGMVNVAGTSQLTVNGDVNNSGTISTAGLVVNTGGDIIRINGSLINQAGGQFILYGGTLGGEGDLATIGGGMTNSGLVDVENLSTLQIGGDVTNSGTLETDALGIGGANAITIKGMLVNNGDFLLDGPGDVATVGNGLINTLAIDVEGHSTLQVNGNVNNSGSFYSGAFSSGGDTLAISGSLTTSNFFGLFGHGDMGTIGAGMNNSGIVEVDDGSTLLIMGDATNSGGLYTGNNFALPGGDTLIITGTLTNQPGGLNNGQFILESPGDRATLGGLINSALVDVENGNKLEIDGNVTNSGILGTAYFGFAFSVGGALTTINGSLTNSGQVDVEFGGTLQVNGDVNNSGMLVTNLNGSGGGNTVNITGMLVNSGTFRLNGPRDVASIGNGMSNAGFVDLENGSTLTIIGNVTNTAGGSGLGIYTSYNGTGGNTLNVSGTLTNNGGADFFLNGPSDVATLGGLDNSGRVDVNGGSKLQINGDVNNLGDLLTGNFGTGGNTLNITGTLTNQYPGDFILQGHGDVATLGGLTNFSFVAVDGGSTLQINGSVNNSEGDIFTGSNGTGGNTLNITGTLTNNAGNLELLGPGDMATLGGLDNSGESGVDVVRGSTLQINGDVSNSELSTLATDLGGSGGGNTVTITGMLTNSGTFELLGPGDKATIGSLTNSGFIDLENNSTLTVTGDVNNGGDIYTSDFGGSGHNTITIDGELTFSPGGQVKLFNLTDKLVISGGGSIELNHGAAISTPTLNNGGTINIDSVSTLLVGLGSFHGPSANYTQLANGTLTEMISSPTSFGVINVSGSALLDGTLAVMLQGGFTPADGSLFKFLIASPGELSGVFSDAPDPGVWKLIYDYADGYVEAEYVPEPATLLVLIPGLLGMGYGLRRKLLQ